MGFAKQVKSDRTTELVDQLLADAAGAMVIMGADGRIVRVNSQAEKLFGYSQAELLGQKPDLLLPWPRNVRHRAGQVTPRFVHFFWRRWPAAVMGPSCASRSVWAF
jgi:PAS domain-containing protein